MTLSLWEISLRSLNSPWGFRFPKRPFWKASTQINIGYWSPKTATLGNVSEMVSSKVFQTSFRSLLGLSLGYLSLPKQIFEESSRRPYFITFSLQGISLRSIDSPWGFDFQNGRFGNQVLKQILEGGSRHLYLVTLSLGGISLRYLNSPRGYRFSERPFWNASTQINIGS